MVGIVTQIGEDVTQFRPGDRVWTNNQGYDGRQGTFAEYCRVNENLLYHLPAGIGPVQAVTVLHSSLTAILGLFFKAKLAAGETIFINGGGGKIRTTGLPLGQSRGARVLGATGNEGKGPTGRAVGAE